MKPKPKCPCCGGAGSVRSNPRTYGGEGRICPQCNGAKWIPKPKPRAKRKSQVVPNAVAEEREFIKKLKAAFNADLSQFFTDSLTPDRGYATPIDNLKKLFRGLRAENATLRAKLAVLESIQRDA